MTLLDGMSDGVVVFGLKCSMRIPRSQSMLPVITRSS